MKKFIKILVGIILVMALIGGCFGLYITYEILQNKPEINVDDFYSSDSTVIYDKNDEVIAELGLYIRENIAYNALSNNIIDAFIATEDSRYFEHNGFDIPRFVKAFLENLKTMSFSQGGSTFTMQLIKNTYFQIDDGDQSTIASKSIDRKVNEIFMAMELTKIMPKEDVLIAYLNKINFGANIRGIEKASEYYFGKSASDVNLSEAALLAGVINGPNGFNPYNYLDKATERRDTVLDLMLLHGYITETECKLAKSIKLEDLLVGKNESINPSGAPYQSYIDAVIKETYQITGLDPSYDTMKIYTNMDPVIQNEIEKIQDQEYEHIQFENDLKQISLVSIDNETGAIVGLGGGRNYDGSLLFNRATEMYMQPGSTVKPFFNYALAFEHLGWSSEHVICDQPIVYRGTDIPLYNFNRRFYGDVPIKFAVGISLNTPVIQSITELADLLGPDYLVQYLQNLGFSQVKPETFDLGFAIGGSAFRVSPVELAGAYVMLMNKGEYVEPHTIKSIEYNGKTYDKQVTKNKVLSEEAAYLVSLLTRDNVETDYNNYMQILNSNYPVYAKTGTSDWGKEGTAYGIPEGAPKDRWMIASTKDYTNLVWEGFDKAIEGEQTWLTDQDGRYNIRGKSLRILLDTEHPEDSELPGPVERPEGISNITYTQGTWPYAYIEGTNIVTAQIKSEFNKLVDPYTTVPSTDLKGISASIQEDGAYRVDFSGSVFYDENGTPKRNLILNVGNKTIQDVGRVIFDYSTILGNPTYYVRVYDNNNFLVNETSAESGSVYGWLDPSIQGSLKACGYYYYPNGASSNEVCTKMR